MGNCVIGDEKMLHTSNEWNLSEQRDEDQGMGAQV